MLLAFSVKSQVNFTKSFLINNRFTLIDVRYNGQSGMNDLENFYFKQFNYRPLMEMRAIIYDSTKAEHRKLAGKQNIQQHDTLLIESWDTKGSMLPFFKTISKFTYHALDSTLTFYESKYLENNYKYAKPVVTRNFKVTKTEKDRLYLLDKDFTDVKRLFILKIKSK